MRTLMMAPMASATGMTSFVMKGDGSMGRVQKGIVAVGMALALLAAGAVAGKAEAAGIPTDVAVYHVAIGGDTFDGAYPFNRSGYLIVEPPLGAAGGANFNNGANARDVGLFSGNPSGSPESGSIWFATSTTIFQQIGVGNGAQGLAGLDVAYVSADEQNGVLDVRIDGRAAGASQLGSFNAKSGLDANIYQVVLGRMLLQFSPDSQNVTGTVIAIGKGYIYGDQAVYRASIQGVRVQQ